MDKVFETHKVCYVCKILSELLLMIRYHFGREERSEGAGDCGDDDNTFYNYFQFTGASLVTQMVKNLPVMLETWVQSLGQEDPLEKGMATHSSILAWRMPGTEELGWL